MFEISENILPLPRLTKHFLLFQDSPKFYNIGSNYINFCYFSSYFEKECFTMKILSLVHKCKDFSQPLTYFIK